MSATSTGSSSAGHGAGCTCSGFETSAATPAEPNDLEFGLTLCCRSHLLQEKVYFISKSLLLKIQLKNTVESPAAAQALCCASGCRAGARHRCQQLNTAEKPGTGASQPRQRHRPSPLRCFGNISWAYIYLAKRKYFSGDWGEGKEG